MVKLVEELLEFKKGILTAEQAAEILGVTTNTLVKWRWTKRYPLPYLKIGGKVRYRAQDVAAFLESRVENANPPTSSRRRARKAA
jgi:excisionase family DNA binding protein